MNFYLIFILFFKIIICLICRIDKPIRIGYDMNAREELIRSYNEKEISLSESMEKEKRLTKNLKMEIKGNTKTGMNCYEKFLLIIVVSPEKLCKIDEILG